MGRPAGGESLVVWLARNTGSTARRRVLESVGRLLADTCLRGLAVRNLGAARLGLARGPGGDYHAYWQGIEATALRRPLPRHIRSWMVAALREDVRAWMTDPSRRSAAPVLSRPDRARVVRAFHRRLGERWKDVCREMQAE